MRRIEQVGQRFGKDVQLGLVSGLGLFRHASDIGRGTLFSLFYSIGATEPREPPKSMAQMTERQTEQAGIILLFLVMARQALFEVMALQLGLNDLRSESKKLVKASLGHAVQHRSS